MNVFLLRFRKGLLWGSNEQYSSIGSDNGLAPTRQQAIIWANDGYFTDTYMSLSLINKLMCQCWVDIQDKNLVITDPATKQDLFSPKFP